MLIQEMDGLGYSNAPGYLKNYCNYLCLVKFGGFIENVIIDKVLID